MSESLREGAGTVMSSQTEGASPFRSKVIHTKARAEGEQGPPTEKVGPCTPTSRGRSLVQGIYSQLYLL